MNKKLFLKESFLLLYSFYKIKLRRFYFSVWWFIMQSYELGLGEDLGNHLLFIYFSLCTPFAFFISNAPWTNLMKEHLFFLQNKIILLGYVCVVYVFSSWSFCPFSEKSLRLIDKGCILHLRFCWCGATWPPWHLPREEEVGRGENRAQSRFV